MGPAGGNRISDPPPPPKCHAPSRSRPATRPFQDSKKLRDVIRLIGRGPSDGNTLSSSRLMTFVR